MLAILEQTWFTSQQIHQLILIRLKHKIKSYLYKHVQINSKTYEISDLFQ